MTSRLFGLSLALLGLFMTSCGGSGQEYSGDGSGDGEDAEAEDIYHDLINDTSNDPALDETDDRDGSDPSSVEELTDELDLFEEPGFPPGLAWVSIPGGTFEMGCSVEDEPSWWDCMFDTPRHWVTLSDFHMTETEITQEQYEWVMGYNPSVIMGCEDRCPVVQVTWHDAKAFCEAIGGRLPSEAEWEYAARAGTTSVYTCGDDASCLEDIAWTFENSGYRLHPVGEKTANAFGLYDMLGNVWEWIEDCWHYDYVGAPTLGEAWTSGDCSERVRRGCSWRCDHEDPSFDLLRVSTRYYFNPDDYKIDLGLRCAQ